MTSLINRMRQNPALMNAARSELVKQGADWKDIAKMTAAFTGGSVAAATLGSELTGGYQKLRGAITKKRNFHRMMKENPDLQHLDDKQVQLAFNTIQRFNPDFAGDPLVAGTWTRQIAGYGEGVPADRAAQLVQAATNLNKLRSAPGLKDITGAMGREGKDGSPGTGIMGAAAASSAPSIVGKEIEENLKAGDLFKGLD